MRPRTRSPRPRRWTRRGLLVLGLLLLQAALLEAALRGAVAAGVLDLPRPRGAGSGFWVTHPVFGVWHRPDAEFRHVKECFDVFYRTNSVGARDRERERESEAPRVVVLGDSFAEGWGVTAETRLSDRLERETGIPQLNFGMAHFSPYQQVLVYRELARKFDHDAVLSLVLPRNDFLDLSLRSAEDAPGYDYRYRPYLVPDGAGFRHVELREPWLRGWLRRHTFVFQAWRALRSADQAAPAPTADPASGFYDFRPGEIALLEASIERLAEAAEGRPVVVVLVPDPEDLARFERDGPDPLSRRLRDFGAHHGVRVVNLLPAFHAMTRSWQRYFHPCDFHWSAFGNEAAARVLRREIADLLPRERPRRRSGGDDARAR